jgi:hypothetical protein
VRSHKLRLFADDTNLFVSGSNLTDVFNTTQDILNTLCQWFKDNQLTLNIDKTCYSVFTNKAIPECSLLIDNVLIKRENSVRYLGMYLDEKLNFKSHIDHICKKLIQLTGASGYISKFIHKNNLLQIYFAYIFPHIKYGIEIFGCCPGYIFKQLQATQTRLLKLLLGKGRRESTTNMFRDLGLLNCNQIYELYLCLFVYKQQNLLLPQIFNGFYILVKHTGRRTTRQFNDIFLPKYRTTQGQKSVKYVGGKMWNNLPIHIKNSRSVVIFKTQCKLYLQNK